jgi:hypothetical protein
MLALLKNEHTQLKTQAIKLNDDGAVLAQWCKRLHARCPGKAIGKLREEYMNLIDEIERYDNEVTKYGDRSAKVMLIAELFEKKASTKPDKSDFIAGVSITTDLTRWNNNTKKLLEDIAKERALALTKV